MSEDLVRELVAIMDGEDTAAAAFSETPVAGEFCIFTAEPEGKVENPDGSERDAWTEARLRQVVENFGAEGRIAKGNPALALENPVVIGHEEDAEFMRRTDTPAAGWIDRLRLEGGKLIASFRDMPEKVAGWIKARTFDKRSAEFYPDYHGFGGTLRRVALLGGEIPAKKDLAGTVFFREAEPQFVVAFQEGPTMPLNQVIEAKLTEMAGEDEGQRMALMGRLMQATQLTAGGLQDILSGEQQTAPGPVLDGIAEVLNIPRAELAIYEDGAAEVETQEGAPAPEEAAAMAEKTKTPAKPAADPKVPAPEAHGEPVVTKAQLDVAVATIDEAKGRISALETENARLARDRSAAEITAFCERMAREGRFVGAANDAISMALRRAGGIEKFNEAEAKQTEAERLMDLLPKVAQPVDVTGRVVSREVVKPQVDRFTEIDGVHEKWAADPLGKTGDMEFRLYAYASGVKVDDFAEWDKTRNGKTAPK